MTEAPIHTLPPAELRGYARGLRESAARMTNANPFSIQSTRTELLREADLTEGFADRLEKAAPPAVKPAAGLRDAELSPLGRRFAEMLDPSRIRASAHVAPSVGVKVCPAADIECLPSCESWKGGACRRWMIDQVGKGDAAKAAHHTPPDTFPLPTDTAAELETLIPSGTAQPTAEEQAQPGLADAVAEHLAEPPPASEPKPSPIWTAERLALLRRLWPTTMHLDAIHAALNALPGEPISSPGGVKVKASKLELHRRGEAIPPEYAGAAESRTARRSAPEATPAPTPTTPLAEPIKPSPAMLPEDKAEAREKLRTGEFKGARAIIEEYGCTEAEAMALVEEHRNRLGKAA